MEHDINVSFGFLRFTMSGQPLAQRRGLNEILDTMIVNPTAGVLGGLRFALEAPHIDNQSYVSGMVAGVALAMASNEKGPSTIRGFLEEWSKKAANTVDIARAKAKK